MASPPPPPPPPPLSPHPLLSFSISGSAGFERAEFITDRARVWFPREQALTRCASGRQRERRGRPRSCILQRELCNVYSCRWEACSMRGPGVLPSRSCAHSALPDKWRQLNHLGDCSRAIDFVGHQIKAGCAEHMPFSTGQSLSFSQINSSNYATPPPEINPEAIVPPSRNRNGEVRCC